MGSVDEWVYVCGDLFFDGLYLLTEGFYVQLASIRGLYRQVVSVDRWSFCSVGLYMWSL